MVLEMAAEVSLVVKANVDGHHRRRHPFEQLPTGLVKASADEVAVRR